MSVTNFNYENAMQELISAIPAGEEGALMINEFGLQKAAFIAYLSKFGIDLEEQHLAKRIQTAVLLDGKNTNGLSNYEMFTGSFNSDLSNMKNGSYVLPEGEHKIVFGIYIETGTLAPGDTIPANYTPGNSSAFQNAYVTLKNNGTTVATEIPLTLADSAILTRSRGYIALDQPIIWKGQTDLVAQIKDKLPQIGDTVLRIGYVSIGLIS